MSEERKRQLILDLDNNGVVDALTDGLLMLRYLFGLRGDSLIDGAVADQEPAGGFDEGVTSAARNTADEIEEYIDNPAVQELLDLDGDGTVDALTDGLALLRYGFGLEGESLADGAIAPKAKEMGMDAAKLTERIDNIITSKLQLDDEGKIYTEDGEIPFIARDGKKYETSNITTEYKEPEPEPEPDPVDPYDATENVFTYLERNNLDRNPTSDEIVLRFNYFRDNRSSLRTDEAVNEWEAETRRIADDAPDEYVQAMEGLGKYGIDTDKDGAHDYIDFRSDDSRFSTEEEYDSYVADLEAKKPGVKYNEDGRPTSFNNPIPGEGVTMMEYGYQGYDMPLTPDQLIEGYLTIKRGETWVDPRWEEATKMKYRDVRMAEDNASRPPHERAYETWHNYAGDEVVRNTTNHHAEKFLARYTQADVNYMGKGTQEVEDYRRVPIVYGVHDDKDITLMNLFESRMPAIGDGYMTGIERPTEPLPAEYVPGVDRKPNGDEIAATYYTIQLLEGEKTANGWANGLAAPFKDALIGWRDNQPEVDFRDDKKFLNAMFDNIPAGLINNVGNLYMLSSATVQAWADTEEDPEIKEQAQKIADVLVKWNDPDAELTGADIQLIEAFEQTKDAYYRQFQEETFTEDLFNDPAMEELLFQGKVLLLQDALDPKNRKKYFGSDTKYNIDAYMGETYYQVSAKNYEAAVSRLAGHSYGQNFNYGGNWADLDGDGTIEYHWDVQRWQLQDRVVQNFWFDLMMEQELPMWIQTEVFGYDTLAQDATGETLDKIQKEKWGDTGLWYDPTRLYMKTHDRTGVDHEVDFDEGTGNGTAQIDSAIWMDGLLPADFDWGDDPFRNEESKVDWNGNYREGYFRENRDDPTTNDLIYTNQEPYYGNFSNPSSKHNKGQGFYVDITGGDAPMGSYSLVWVAQPEWQTGWDNFLNAPMTQLINFIPGGAIVLAGLKRLNGQTLHGEDYASVVLDFLKLKGDLKMPVGEEAAIEASDAAMEQAMIDYPNITGAELRSIGADAYDLARSGISPFSFLTPVQTVGMINALATQENIGNTIVKTFGGEYLESGLMNLGFDVSNIPAGVMNSITDVATDMLDGMSFEDAVREEAAAELLDYFSAMGKEGQLKSFIDQMMGDLSGAVDALKLMGKELEEAPLFKELLEVVEAGLDSDVVRAIVQTGEIAFDSVSNLIGKVEDIAEKIDEVAIDPLEPMFKQGMSKFTVMGQKLYDELPDDIQGQVDTLFTNIDTATGGILDNLGDGVKNGVRESLVSLMVSGEVDEARIAQAISKETITVRTIDSMDGELVDAVGAPLITSALRNTLTTAMLDGDPGQAFLQTIGNGVKAAIQEAYDAGGLDGVQDKFLDFSTKYSGVYAEAEEAANEYNKLPAQLAEKVGERNALQAELEADRKELLRLREIAVASDSTQEQLDEYNAYSEQFNSTIDSRQSTITQLDSDIDGLLEDQATLKQDYDDAFSRLSGATQEYDDDLKVYYDDVYTSTLLHLNPEFNLGEYAAANGLPEGSDARDVAEHYLTNGYKNGAPVSAEEYNERLETRKSGLTTSALVATGIDVTKLDKQTLQNLENSLLIQADAEAKKEGKTLVQYLEDNASAPSEGYTALLDNSIGTAFNMSIPEFEASLPERRAMDLFSNLYDNFDDMSPKEKRDVMLGIATDKVTWVVKDGDVEWGGDGFQRQEWNESLQQFQTYQYDAGGQTKYLVNDDGSVPMFGDREYLTVSSVNSLSTIRETNPLSYYTFTSQAIEENQPAIAWFAEEMAKGNRLLEEGASQEELETHFKDINDKAREYRFEQEGGVAGIPYSELPWSVRAANLSLRFIDAEITAHQKEIDRLEAMPEDERGIGHSVELANAKALLALSEGEKFATATAIRVAGGASSYVSQTYHAGLKYIETYPARIAAQDARQTILDSSFAQTGKFDYVAADAAYNAVYLERTKDIDYRVLVDHPNAKNMQMLEDMAFGFYSPEYQADTGEFFKNLDAAEGFGDTMSVLFGEIKDKPSVFLTEIVGIEFGQELFSLAASLGAGQVVRRSVLQDMGEEAAKKMGIAAATLTNVGLDAVEVWGPTVVKTYDEVKAELIKIGMSEEEADAKAFEIGSGAGTLALLFASVIPGSRALDNKILSGGGNEALKELGERIFEGVTISSKEAVNEVIQEAVSTGYTELALYNSGVTDRDWSGNLAAQTGLAGLGAFSTTGSIYGLSIPVSTDSNSESGGGGFNPLTNAVISSPQVQLAIESGNPVQLELFLTSNGFELDSPLTNNIMNIVDDGNYVSTVEAKETFDYLGVEPTQQDLFALAGNKTDDEESLIIEGEAYWVDKYGEENLGTGRTAEQHYDIIRYMNGMIDGVYDVNLDFNSDGDSVITQRDIDAYLASMPQRELVLYSQYNAEVRLGAKTHEDTGIIDELGGSLMTSEELETLKSNIDDLMENNFTKEEIITAVMSDPTITALPGSVETAVNNAFTKKENKEAFAAEVIAQLVADETISTASETAVASALGNAEDGTGIYKVIEDIKTEIGLGADDGTLKSYIDGLIDTVTGAGVTRDAAISAIQGVLGSPAVAATTEEVEIDGKMVEREIPAVPATGIFALIEKADSTDAAIADIETQYGSLDDSYSALNTSYTKLVSDLTSVNAILGTAYAPARTEIVDDEEVEIPAQAATGLHALIADAVAKGAGAESAVKDLLGDYVDFAAFESAVNNTLTSQVNDIKDLFGTPVVYKYDEDGKLVRDDTTNEPVVETAATGYQLDMFNAMKLEGESRDLALLKLEGKITNALAEVESVSANATASAIKKDILDVYFPTKPDTYEAGRAIQDELVYVNLLVDMGEYDAAYDFNNDEKVDDADRTSYMAALTEEQVTALGSYNTWSSNTTAITPMLETIAMATGANFAVVDRKLSSVEANVTDYIKDNVITAIGTPSTPATELTTAQPATGIYKAIEDGDADILDVLGSLATTKEVDGEDVEVPGEGLLGDMQLLGMDVTAIKNYIDTNLGTPATTKIVDGEEVVVPATGIFALIGANQTTLDNIAAWYGQPATDKKPATGLLGDIATIQGDVAAIETDVAAIETDVAAIETDVAAIETDVADIETAIGTASTENKVGTGLVRQLELLGVADEDIKTVIGVPATTEIVDGKEVAVPATGLYLAMQQAASAATTDLAKATAVTNLTNLIGTPATTELVDDEEVDVPATGIYALIADTVETGTDGLATDDSVTALSTAIGNAEDKTGLYSSISAIETDIGTIQTDVAAIETDVAAIETDVSDIETDVADIETDVAAIETDVSDIETAIGIASTEDTVGTGLVRQLELLGVADEDIKTIIGAPATTEIVDDEEVAVPATGLYLAMEQAANAATTDLAKATAVTDLTTLIGTPATTELVDGEEVDVPATGIYALIDDTIETGTDGLATDTSVSALSTAIGNAEDKTGLYGSISAIETDVAAIETAVSDLETNLIAKIDANEAAGLARDEATEKALDDFSTELGTTEEAILDELGTTKDALSAEISGISDQITGVSTDIQVVTELLGKPANLVTQDDVELATQYLDSVEQENELRYDVDNTGTFDQTDVDLMQYAFETGDYSGFVDSEFGAATGMFAQIEQDRQQIADYQEDIKNLEAERIAAEAQYQADIEAQQELQMEQMQQMQTDITTQFQQEIKDQEDEEKQAEMFEALFEPGRKVEQKRSPKANIEYFYDISGKESGIFANPQQQGFFGAASPYGQNFLNDILSPQGRAKGGMIKDKTDEILKIIGDK
jgi:predicted  nucleic acid-binding Zn-ribbon protein